MFDGMFGMSRLQDHQILEPFDAKNIPGPLLFVDEGAKSHSVFEW